MHNVQPAARLGGLVASGLIDVTSDLAALDSAGRWAVVIPYRGDPVLAHFEHWISASAASVAGAWTGPQASFAEVAARIDAPRLVERAQKLAQKVTQTRN